MSQSVTGKSIHHQLQLSVLVTAEAPYQFLQLRDYRFPYWTCSYVQKGRVITETKGVRKELLPGSLMLHPPNITFSEWADTPGTHLWFAFQATLAQNLEFFHLYPVPLTLDISCSAEYELQFYRLFTKWRDNTDPFRDQAVFAETSGLFHQILREWERQGRPVREEEAMTSQDRFAKVIHYMKEHLTMKISRERLAELVHLHPVYLDRVFRDTYGVTPMDMLKSLRLQFAKEKLESTSDTLEAIAGECGLGSSAYFIRIFKQAEGITPGEYREQTQRLARNYLS
ncbi:helix-turn-helix domain-containing protein [Paenibacillus caseinilyticus]|uniref:HTH araC/xylS-type domain-containing protein n=1 Tax=Paenibacillus mucilaginosus K02 TaxID=997761 RepID=R9ULB1_9BACL|nr:AraC family transcriptional regulator [Paenibacillus mucilaginosus]AGN70634.1 hypothetical protein B2K_39000 [Paenibacillus mucilaginosus K02]